MNNKDEKKWIQYSVTIEDKLIFDSLLARYKMLTGKYSIPKFNIVNDALRDAIEFIEREQNNG